MININVGLTANDGLGDKLRDAFIIVNENFTSIQQTLSGTGSFTISQVQGLQTALNNINNQLVYIPSLQSDINSINNTIYTINQTLNSQNASIADLYDEITNLQNQIYNKINEAPIDGITYGRKDGDWVVVSGGAGSIDLDGVLANGDTATGKSITLNDGSLSVSNTAVNTSIAASFVQQNTNDASYSELSPGSIFLKANGSAGSQFLKANPTQNSSYTPTYYLPSKPLTGIYTLATTTDILTVSSTNTNTLAINSSGVNRALNARGLTSSNQTITISSTGSSTNNTWGWDLSANTNLLVPYTGAIKGVDLGTFGITASSFGFTGLTNSGVITWNDADGTMDLTLKGGNVTLQVGQEQVLRVVNKTATNIDLLEGNYQAVRVTGAQGNRLKVDLAQATSDLLSAETIGLVTETILNNQEGFVTTSGLVRGINTTGSLQGETWSDGDILYLSPTTAGSITNVKPVAPQHLIIIGYVVRAHNNQGSIFVKVDNGYEIDELHNVKISGTPSNGDLLVYNKSSNVWENETEEFKLRQRVRVISSDFLGTVAAANTPFTFTGYNSGTNTTTTLLNGENPGVTRIASSATPTSGGSLSSNSLATGNFVPRVGQQFDLVFRTPNTIIGVGSTIRAGFMLATNTATDATQGFYMEIVDNQLYGKTSASSVRSTTSTAYSISNGGFWFHFRGLYKASGLIEYSLYNMAGTILWSDTLTTNIPTSLLGCNILAVSSGTKTSATEMIALDYVAFTLPTSTRGALN